MDDVRALIAEVYAAFNRRDIDAAFARMSENVSWPKASEGGRVVGKDAIRDYWTRQWQAFDPHVEPLEVTAGDDGKVDVRVHQVVKSLAGNVLADAEVRHTYTIAAGLIERMDLDDAAGGPSPAFSHN